MSPEVIAILGVGVTIAALVISGQRAIRADLTAGLATASAERTAIRNDLAALRADVHALAERVARLEGAVPFLMPRPLPASEEPNPAELT